MQDCVLQLVRDGPEHSFPPFCGCICIVRVFLPGPQDLLQLLQVDHWQSTGTKIILKLLRVEMNYHL